jgi:SAM-dependent methyltransferase
MRLRGMLDGVFQAADAYDRYIGRYSGALGRALIAAAEVREGERALDVGCGPGGLTAELVELLGPGRVAAVDPSEAFATAARGRLPGVDVRVAPAEALPFEDDAFDVALAQLVVNFMADPVAGVRELRRVGGRVAAAVWDYAGEMTLLRRFWDAAVASDPAAAAFDEGRGTLCTPDGLRALWTQAGLGGVTVTSAVVEAAYDDFEDLWAPFERGVGPAGAWAVSLGHEDRMALKAQFHGRLAVPAGPFTLTARAWMVCGR